MNLGLDPNTASRIISETAYLISFDFPLLTLPFKLQKHDMIETDDSTQRFNRESVEMLMVGIIQAEEILSNALRTLEKQTHKLEVLIESLQQADEEVERTLLK